MVGAAAASASAGGGGDVVVAGVGGVSKMEESHTSGDKVTCCESGDC